MNFSTFCEKKTAKTDKSCQSYGNWKFYHAPQDRDHSANSNIEYHDLDSWGLRRLHVDPEYVGAGCKTMQLISDRYNASGKSYVEAAQKFHFNYFLQRLRKKWFIFTNSCQIWPGNFIQKIKLLMPAFAAIFN